MQIQKDYYLKLDREIKEQKEKTKQVTPKIRKSLQQPLQIIEEELFYETEELKPKQFKSEYEFQIESSNKSLRPPQVEAEEQTLLVAEKCVNQFLE